MEISFLLAGIILFVYSIDLLTNDLLKLSIDNIKTKLKKLTFSLHSSILTGFISTAIIQSSSAIIMITIALINANLLNFNQSFGIVLGSNIATTITSFIVGLNIEKFSPFLMGIALCFFTSKNHLFSIIFSIC